MEFINYEFYFLKYYNFSCHTGKELNDPRVLTDVGDVPIQEIRDCGVDDDRLMNIISESVKLVMEEVRLHIFICETDTLSYNLILYSIRYMKNISKCTF